MANATKLFTNSDNMRQFGAEFLKPDWTDWKTYVAKMWLTVQIAMWGTFLAVFIAVPFGLACARNVSPVWLQQPMRLLMNLLRSVPTWWWAPCSWWRWASGPSRASWRSRSGTGAVLAKLFSEAVEAHRPRPRRGGSAPPEPTGLQEIVWGILPQVAPLWTSYALYRFESNSRSATVLG
jgi:phosphonate transport system permease protein